MGLVKLYNVLYEQVQETDLSSEPDGEEASEGDDAVALSPADIETLDKLKGSTERAIVASVDSPEAISREAGGMVVVEDASLAGFAYEPKVLAAIAKAGLTGLIKTGAGASAAAADADMKINGQILKIEVKLARNAQMGGSSIRVNEQGSVSLAKSISKEVDKLLVAAVKKNLGSIRTLLEFLGKQKPAAINKRSVSFPVSCTTEAWEKAAARGLLVNVPRIPYSVDFISDHYAKKGTHYIQIGGAGLFYMSENPGNLPIPKLEGDINIEIRSARSGSKTLACGERVVGGGLRVQARLKTKAVSPYTADDPKSLREMIKAMSKTRKV